MYKVGGIDNTATVYSSGTLAVHSGATATIYNDAEATLYRGVSDATVYYRAIVTMCESRSG